MSCSWQDFYSVDNRKLNIAFQACDRNIPTILTIAPGHTETVDIRLISDTMYPIEIAFKIGFNLMKVSKGQNFIDYDYKKQEEKENVIWSNAISM